MIMNRSAELNAHIQYRTKAMLEILEVITPPPQPLATCAGENEIEEGSSAKEEPISGNGTQSVQQDLLVEVREMRVSPAANNDLLDRNR
jgi:hypothetical protein